MEKKTPHLLLELVEKMKNEIERLVKEEREHEKETRKFEMEARGFEKKARELAKEQDERAASLLLSTSLNKELQERVEKMEAEKKRDDVEKAEIKRKLTKEIAKNMEEKMEGMMAEAKANLEKKYEERLTGEREKMKAEIKGTMEQLSNAQQENFSLQAKLRLMRSTLQNVIFKFHNRRLFLLDTLPLHRIRIKRTVIYKFQISGDGHFQQQHLFPESLGMKIGALQPGLPPFLSPFCNQFEF